MRVKVRVSQPVWPYMVLAILALLALLVIKASWGGYEEVVEIDVVTALNEADTSDAASINQSQSQSRSSQTDVALMPLSVSAEAIPLTPGNTVNVTLETAPLSERPDVPVSVYDHRAGVLLELRLEEYLCGVVASEMPARFELEALKAQAIAARTYAYAKLSGGGCTRYGADICTNSAHCQAWHSAAELREGWGKRADEYAAKIERAVNETAGQILTYAGEPINALFHASSGGHTEDVENVYAAALPYLRGVESPGEESMSGYASQVRLSASEFKRKAANAGCKLSDEALSAQVRVSERTAAGYVSGLNVGGTVLDGRAARKAFGLRSASFAVSFEADAVIFDVRGYGHGVGMSQTGANAMAQSGHNCNEILHYYYTDVDIELLKS